MHLADCDTSDAGRAQRADALQGAQAEPVVRGVQRGGHGHGEHVGRTGRDPSGTSRKAFPRRGASVEM